MRKYTLLLLLLLVGIQALTAEVITLPGLGKPDSLTLFKDRLYITDQEKIYIYSIQGSKPVLIKTFGRAGEGPGEFKVSAIDRIGLRIIFRQENIMVNSWGKLSTFSKDGTFIEEKKVLLTPHAQFLKPLGNKYVGYIRANLDNVNYFFVHFFDPLTLQKEKEICRMKGYIANNSIDIMWIALAFKNDTRRGPIYQVYNDRLFVEGEDCRIFVYDQQGKEIRSFSVHDYEKLEITEDFKKEVMAYLEKRAPNISRSAKRNGYFPRYLPLRSFRVDDGKIYVQTFKREKEKSEFYIFDLDGKLIRKVMAPIRESEFLVDYPFTIANGKIYQLTENDDTEEWELHIDNI
jgi:outer membrane protein assembly factor BamB